MARHLVSRGCSTDILLGAALGDTAVVARHLLANPSAVRTSVDATWFPMKNLHAGGSIYIWTLGSRKTAHTIAREFGHADVEQFLWKASDDSLSLTMACELGDDERVSALIAERPELVRALQPGRRHPHRRGRGASKPGGRETDAGDRMAGRDRSIAAG